MFRCKSSPPTTHHPSQPLFPSTWTATTTAPQHHTLPRPQCQWRNPPRPALCVPPSLFPAIKLTTPRPTPLHPSAHAQRSPPPVLFLSTCHVSLSFAHAAWPCASFLSSSVPLSPPPVLAHALLSRSFPSQHPNPMSSRTPLSAPWIQIPVCGMRTPCCPFCPSRR
jgi:hypothetical protein